jgi:hypothetical protein
MDSGAFFSFFSVLAEQDRPHRFDSRSGSGRPDHARVAATVFGLTVRHALSAKQLSS